MKRWQRPALLVLLSLAAAGCGGAGAEPPREGVSAASADSRVRRAEFVQRFLLTGELKAVRSDNIVVPRSEDWQVQIRWIEEDGARVRQGQKVVELDNTAVVSDLEEKTLAAVSADFDLEQKQADLTGQEQDKRFQLEQRQVELSKAEIEAAVPEEILGRRAYQERQLALSRARVEHQKAATEMESFLKSAEAELAILEIARDKAIREVEAAERSIEAMILRAPRDGILVVAENPREGRKFQVGDSAWVGLTVARIPDLAEMAVEALLSDVDDGRIRPAQRAECIVDAYPQERFGCEITEITPVAQEAGMRSLRRGFRVQVRLDRTDPERMRPGMSVKVDVETLRLPQALLAPRRALDLAAEPPVALLEGGRRAEVRVGACNGRECVIEAGLSEGDRLGGAR